MTCALTSITGDLKDRCYIGRRQLEAAINAVEKEASFVVSWKPFLLDAHTIPEGIPLQVYLTNKYGEKVAKQELKGQGPLAKAGKSVGIKFDPDRYVVNSVKSHLLLQFVFENYGSEKQSEVRDLITQQYFEEAVNLNSDKVLQNLAGRCGINIEKASEFFTSPTNVKRLFNEIQKTRKRGILGVPYFIIHIDGYNDKRPLTFSGGQNKSGFVDTFHKLLKEYRKAQKVKQ